MASRTFLVCLSVIACATAFSQSSLLPLELQVRGGVSLLPNGSGHYSAPTISMDLLTNPGRIIGVGISLQAGNGRSNWLDGTTNYAEPAHHVYGGVNLRLARSRVATFRPFAQFRYGLLSMATTVNGKTEQFTTGNFGFSTGLMTRLGKRVHLILPEVGFCLRSKGFSFETPNDYLFNTPYIPVLHISTGLAWQIGFEK